MKKGRALEVRFQHTFENSVGTARTHQQQQHAALHLQLAGVSPGTPPDRPPSPLQGAAPRRQGAPPAPSQRDEVRSHPPARSRHLPSPRGADIKDLEGEPRVPPPPQGKERAWSFSVRYLCTPGSWGCVSQVSCSSCCRRCPASAAAGPSPCPPRPRRLPPTTAAWRWGAAGCRLAPLPARCCCPPRRRGSGSGCAGCPAGAGRGRWLGWAAAGGCSPPRRPRCWGPRPCRHRRWGTRRRRASSSAAGAGGGTGGSARSWTTRTWRGARPRAAHALRRGKDPSAAPGAPHAPAAGEEGREGAGRERRFPARGSLRAAARLPPALLIGDRSHAKLRPSLPAPASWAPGALPSPAAAHIVRRGRLTADGGGARRERAEAAGQEGRGKVRRSRPAPASVPCQRPGAAASTIRCPRRPTAEWQRAAPTPGRDG